MRQGWLGASLLAISAATMVARTADAAPKGMEEITVTARKRVETLQKVPMNIEVIDSRHLAQLQVNEFQDYIKFLPSVSFQTFGLNQTSIYMRGVSSGDNANHSGPLPTVGSYFDEFPTTTIGGTLDIHIYDIARVEALPGPQGTLYGASSEAGTLRTISNKPTDHFQAGYDVEGNTVAHGGQGFVAEGFVNVPITDHIAVRLVGFDEHDAGYIDNIAGTRTFATSGATIDNAGFVRRNFNPEDAFGGRAALKIDLNEDWTITPNVIVQDQRSNGIVGYDPSLGDLKIQRFQPDTDHDKWLQSGVTVNGRIGNYDLTYAGGFFVRDVVTQNDYTDYSIYYDQHYGSGAFWQDASGNPLAVPLQEIQGKDHFNKESNELRLASPANDRLRFIVGAFQEIQNHRIIQDYQIQGFGPQIAVPGWANTIWLTDQLRTDRDEAVFGELTYDITPKLTVTGGVRPYWYDNSLKGFFGFSQGYDALTGYSSGEGSTGQHCLAGQSYDEAPCVDINKTVRGSGETHKLNATYKFDDQRLVYFTYSTGYRPGGVNRNANFGPYQADSLTNYELGIKTSWLDRRLRFNAALYDEDWSKFQFSFLGPNSLTIIENAPQANIKGLEIATDLQASEHLTLSAGATFTNARLTQNFCGTYPGSTQLIPSCTAAQAIATAGTPLPYTPNFKGNLTARYGFRLADWDAFVQGSGLFQSHNQVGLRVVDIAAIGNIPAYGTMDFSGGLQKNNLQVSVFVKNAFDQRGEVNRFVTCTVGVCTKVYAVPIQPMTVGIRIAQTF